MSLYEEIEKQEKERIVDSLATENQMLQEPKTPTKEQIEKIWNNHFDTTNTFVLTYVDKKLIEIIITEWEKIRGTEPC